MPRLSFQSGDMFALFASEVDSLVVHPHATLHFFYWQGQHFFSVQTCIMVSELKSCQACVCAIILKKKSCCVLELQSWRTRIATLSWPCKLELEALMELDLEEYVPPFEPRSCRTCSKSLHPDETRGLARSQKKQLQSQGPTLSLVETHAH